MSSNARQAARHPERHTRPGLVVLAYCRPNEVTGLFMDSVLSMWLYDAGHNNRMIGKGAGFIALESGPRIAEARSQIVDRFLESKALADADWLLMLDADMTFEPTLCDRLVAAADPIARPIVGGLCFAGGHSTRQYPTLYKEYTETVNGAEQVGVEPIADYPENTLVKVGATGAACLLVHRNVFLRMSAPFPSGFGTLKDGRKNPYPWFAEGLVDPRGAQMGEDIAFCRKATMLGIPIHVHTGIKLGHVKQYELTEDTYRAFVAAKTELTEVA